jgi:hypothetical protein
VDGADGGTAPRWRSPACATGRTAAGELTLNYSVNDGSNTTNGTVANTLAGATFSVTGVAY